MCQPDVGQAAASGFDVMMGHVLGSVLFLSVSVQGMKVLGRPYQTMTSPAKMNICVYRLQISE